MKPPVADEWHSFDVVAENDDFAVLLDGKQVLSFID